MKKEIKTILKEIVLDGWTVVQGKKHFKLYNHDGKLCASASLTPSDPRTVKNLKSYIKKARREYDGRYN